MCFYDQAKVLNPGLSKNVFSPSSPFHSNVYNHWKTFHITFTFIPNHISDPCSICGCFLFFPLPFSFPLTSCCFLFLVLFFFPVPPSIHCTSSGTSEHLSPPSLFLPLFQSTCDTLRSHSDSLGFAPNVLPSHPTLGNFEEFACWRHGRRGQLAVWRQTVILTCIHVHTYTHSTWRLVHTVNEINQSLNRIRYHRTSTSRQHFPKQYSGYISITQYQQHQPFVSCCENDRKHLFSQWFYTMAEIRRAFFFFFWEQIGSLWLNKAHYCTKGAQTGSNVH